MSGADNQLFMFKPVLSVSGISWNCDISAYSYIVHITDAPAELVGKCLPVARSVGHRSDKPGKGGISRWPENPA
jgi:hypothetical protein